MSYTTTDNSASPTRTSPSAIVVEILAPGVGREVPVSVLESTAHLPAPDGVEAPSKTIELPVDAGAIGDLLRVVMTSLDPLKADVYGVLAREGTAKAALWRLAFQHGRSFDHGLDHGPAAHAEAAAWHDRPGLDDPALLDWTHLPFVTIDAAGVHDLDQAIFLQALKSDPSEPLSDVPSDNMGFAANVDPADAVYRLRYALADASHYIQPGSALFAAAIQRGSSFYLPGITLPMLPRTLGEDLISLNPKQVRRSVVVDLILDASGRCVRSRLIRATIRSRAKLTYAGVQAFYAVGSEHPTSGTTYAASLHLLAEVGRLRLGLARQADIVEFHRTAVDVQLDGATFLTVGDDRLPVERYNAQMAQLCDAEASRLVAEAEMSGQGDSGPPSAQTRHTPGVENLERFVRLVDAVVQCRGLDRDQWRWHRGREPLADYLERLPRSGEQHRVALALERQAMMTNIDHGTSLAAHRYVRFTAPMREIVGVYSHRIALQTSGDSLDVDAEQTLRDRVMAAANEAKIRQDKLRKGANQVVLDILLQRELRMGEQQRWRTGTLVGMSATKLYIELEAPTIEIKVYLRDLPRDGARPRVCAHGGSFILNDCAIALGERVQVRVQGRSERSGRWAFRLRFPDSCEADRLA